MIVMVKICRWHRLWANHNNGDGTDHERIMITVLSWLIPMCTILCCDSTNLYLPSSATIQCTIGVAITHHLLYLVLSSWSIQFAPLWLILNNTMVNLTIRIDRACILTIMMDAIYTIMIGFPSGTHQHDDWSVSTLSWSIPSVLSPSWLAKYILCFVAVQPHSPLSVSWMDAHLYHFPYLYNLQYVPHYYCLSGTNLFSHHVMDMESILIPFWWTPIRNPIVMFMSVMKIAQTWITSWWCVHLCFCIGWWWVWSRWQRLDRSWWRGYGWWRWVRSWGYRL